jgi:hypothetical protein
MERKIMSNETGHPKVSIALDKITSKTKRLQSVCEDIERQLAIAAPGNLYIKSADYKSAIVAAAKDTKNDHGAVLLTYRGIPVKSY